MTKKQIEEQLRMVLEQSGVSVGEFRRIFGKVTIEHEQAVGREESDKGKPWSDAELRGVLSDAPTKENSVKRAKAFGRGYGAPDQIYRWAATTGPEIKRVSNGNGPADLIGIADDWRGRHPQTKRSSTSATGPGDDRKER